MNETIKLLTQRRSIRKFTTDTIDDQTRSQLELAAIHAPSSEFLNDWSAIRIEDQKLKEAIATLGKQPYIAEAALLYIFVLDEHRNTIIAQTKGVNDTDDNYTLNQGYRFTQAQNDAVLALSAMMTVAESFGLGSVVLGSILNDIPQMIELLHLPKYTYPVLGLAIGKPDQNPTIKPRMKAEKFFFANQYANDEEILNGLDQYDKEVHQYYDLRNTATPVDPFSSQIANKATNTDVTHRGLQHAKAQGFEL